MCKKCRILSATAMQAASIREEIEKLKSLEDSFEEVMAQLLQQCDVDFITHIAGDRVRYSYETEDDESMAYETMSVALRKFASNARVGGFVDHFSHPKMCECCLTNVADHPSSMCTGCNAYQDHLDIRS